MAIKGLASLGNRHGCVYMMNSMQPINGHNTYGCYRDARCINSICIFLYCHIAFHFDGLVQHCSISIALAMEILQSCTSPLILCVIQPYLSWYWFFLYSCQYCQIKSGFKFQKSFCFPLRASFKDLCHFNTNSCVLWLKRNHHLKCVKVWNLWKGLHGLWSAHFLPKDYLSMKLHCW